MGILQLYPKDKFYINVSLKEFRRGQFCWLPVPHIDPIPKILDVERSVPTAHKEIKFLLRNANHPEDFTSVDRHLPIKNLNLRSNEELLLQRAKKRPGIIISSKVDIFPELDRLLRQKGKRHLQEDSIFVIPGYSIESEYARTGFPPEIVARTRCLLYRQFFYYPENSRFREGIARFDRIQIVVGRDPAAITPTDICFTEEVFNLFIGMFIYCITGIEDDEIGAARAILREACPDKP